MTAQTVLSIALLVALSSNIVLLLLLVLKSSPVNKERPGRLELVPLIYRLSGDTDDRPYSPELLSEPNPPPAKPRGLQRAPGLRDSSQDYTNSKLLLLGLLQNQLAKSASEQVYWKASNSEEEKDNLGHFPPSWIRETTSHRISSLSRGKDHQVTPIFGDGVLQETAQSGHTTPRTKGEVTPRGDESVTGKEEDYVFAGDLPDHVPAARNRTRGETSWRPSVVGRVRREAVTPSSKTVTSDYWKHKAHEVFSSLTDGELARFDPAVNDILIPALVHLETMIIREFDSLQSIIVGHDLRLETMEQALLNLRENLPEPQADSVDNKSDLPSQILGKKEGLLPLGNSSGILELSLDVDGSGDGNQWTLAPTTLPPREAPVHNVAWYDMYRILGNMEQKVMSLENYNVMSDSELTRVRSEVIKMDDKVTELDRQQRNLHIRTSMHTQKITELEVYMSKSELGIHTALDSYGRVNSRLDTFKDKLGDFKSELQAVSAQFGHHDQITSELRAADSYKAHDIQEVRKSVFSIEGRLSGLYRVLDQNLDTVRTDLRATLERLCKNNKLSC